MTAADCAELARRFSRRDDWSGGRRAFMALRRRRPRDARVLSYLGYFCAKHSRFDTRRALALQTRALALDPGCAQAWAHRAIILGALGRRRGAARALARAAALGLPAPELLRARGAVALESGLARRARLIYRALAREGDADALVLLCQALIQEGRYREATRAAARARAADPGDFRAAVYGAIARAHAGQLARARRELLAALPAARRYALAHYALAFVARRAGDAAEAERRLRGCLRVDPLYVVAREALGEICARSGRRAEARRHFARALRLFPRFARARRALAALERRAQSPADRRARKPSKNDARRRRRRALRSVKSAPARTAKARECSLSQ